MLHSHRVHSGSARRRGHLARKTFSCPCPSDSEKPVRGASGSPFSCHANSARDQEGNSADHAGKRVAPAPHAPHTPQKKEPIRQSHSECRDSDRAHCGAPVSVSSVCDTILPPIMEALWRSGSVYIYRHPRAELLQLARVVTRYVAVRGPGARLAFMAGRLDIPGRGGAREGDGNTPACPSGVAARHSAALCQPPPAWRLARCGAWLLSPGRVRRVRGGCRGYGSPL